MLPRTANFTQSQITRLRDLSYRKTRAIQTTRDNATRAPASLSQDQIPERVTTPTGHRFHDLIRREMLPTGRRIKRDPTPQRTRIGMSITSILSNNNTERKKN